jgi:prepilin-type N-terminal cleavage/methylation domain-containing protein
LFPRAFTLVEMLVVITIIGILASLASVAIFKALEAAKRSRIQAEITQMASAVEQYKQKYSDYPPSNMADASLLSRHLAKAFPRCDPTLEMNSIPMANGSYGASYNAAGAVMSPSQALVFWLTSISKDPVHPLSAKTVDRLSLFDFDKSRLDTSAATATTAPMPSGKAAPGWYAESATSFKYVPSVYMPQSGNGAPYAYFESRAYYFTTGGSPATYRPYAYPATGVGGMYATGNASGTCMPYLWDSNGDSKWDSFVNPKSFQIISAGLDGNYGGVGLTISPSDATNPNMQTAKMYPTGIGYGTDAGDDDNLTNFSEKSLGDAKP